MSKRYKKLYGKRLVHYILIGSEGSELASYWFESRLLRDKMFKMWEDKGYFFHTSLSSDPKLSTVTNEIEGSKAGKCSFYLNYKDIRV